MNRPVEPGHRRDFINPDHHDSRPGPGPGPGPGSARPKTTCPNSTNGISTTTRAVSTRPASLTMPALRRFRPVDLLLIDNPIKDSQQADSDVRQRSWDEWTDVGPTRPAPDARSTTQRETGVTHGRALRHHPSSP